MLITRTPFRISFFGGGTDYYEYFSEHGGCVLSTTIDKYCYVSMRHLPSFFEHKNQITYSKIERFNKAEDIKHPLVRAVLENIHIERIQIAYDADLPACSGLGTSSAFAVGLLQGVHALKNEYPDKMALAHEAIYLERDYLNEAGGVQDQLAASFGGFNIISFDSKGYNIEKVNVSQENKLALNKNLLLAFTGFSRFSSEIAISQKNNIPLNNGQLNEMKLLTYEAEKLLVDGKIDEFGKFLDYTWDLKKSLSAKISNSIIDELYDKAKKNGAIGGKLLGAGGGGFMLFYVPEQEQETFKKNLPELKCVPFAFENEGTQIIYANKNNAL